MDGIRRTPYINPLLGSVNELVGGLLGYMRDPRRTQQMQGLAGLLESTGIPKTVERLAYGEPLTNIQRANVPVLRPETAEALLTLSPVPQATSRAAMAAGRAGERMAERVVPQVMERGGMPAGLLEGMSSRTVSPLTVYHGSPARFERFDPTKIGSGEGAQAYGYGHYVAESPKVADEYRMMLSPHKVTGEAAQDLANYSLRIKPTTEEAINYLQKEKKTAINQSKASSNEFVTSEYIKQYDDAIDLLKSNKGEKSGFLYAIDLPDEQIARMLDWDKPLKDQPEALKAIRNQIQDAEIERSFDANVKSGISGANAMQNYVWGKTPADKSEALRQAGIPGIRYLDQGSRGTGEGTSNFVVFPGGEGLLTIQKRNNEVIAPTGLLDYRIEHRPMTVEGGASRLHDAGSVFGEDIYGKNALQYFGSGLSGEKTSLDILKKVRGNPDAEITIYRGVPEGVNTINKGDWVTLDPKMAEEYGNVISKKVKAKDITTWPDSLVEFGYYPD
jgi:hypothetical protein